MNANTPSKSLSTLGRNAAVYRDQGYYILRQVFGPQDIVALRQACEQLKRTATLFSNDTYVKQTYFELLRPCDPFSKGITQQPIIAGSVRRITYPYAVNSTIDRLRTHPNLLDELEAILGNDICQIVNQINFNPPKQGTGWGWHQDFHFRKRGIKNLHRNFVQTITAIDASNESNGGIRIIPRSDRSGVLAKGLTGDRLAERTEGESIVTPDLRPGDVLLFNPLMVHGSSPNTSPHQRRVFINGYARSTHSEHGLPVRGSPPKGTPNCMEYEMERTPYLYAKLAANSRRV